MKQVDEVKKNALLKRPTPEVLILFTYTSRKRAKGWVLDQYLGIGEPLMV